MRVSCILKSNNGFTNSYQQKRKINTLLLIIFWWYVFIWKHFERTKVQIFEDDISFYQTHISNWTLHAKKQDGKTWSELLKIKKLISMRCPSHRGRSRHGREICAPPGELRSPTALDVRGRVNSWFLNYNCNNWDDPAAKNFFKLNYKTYMNAKKSIVQEQSWKMPPQTSHQLRLHRMRYGERCMKTLKRTCRICMLPGCLGTTQGEGCQSASDPPSVRSGLCTN